MLALEVKDVGVTALFQRLIGGFHNTTPLMRAIAGIFDAETEANFAAEGRPAWMGLAPSTVRSRSKAGTWPGKMLQVSGGLASSVTTRYNRTEAVVGSNKVYAAIHQFGSQAGRGHRIKIDPRPYLPADANGNLSPEAAEAAIGMMTHYLRSLVK